MQSHSQQSVSHWTGNRLWVGVWALSCGVVLASAIVDHAVGAKQETVNQSSNELPYGDEPWPLPTSDSPPSVQESLTAFRMLDGLKIECIASEPEIADPVAMRFDERGRLWVVEMPDYPVPTDPTAPRTGTIKRLEDLDRDGRFETVKLFAQGLDFATGIERYRDGWFVTLGGRLVLMTDRDDDGVMDEQLDVLAGFAQDNTQLRANHPTWGRDGYLYIANGLRGGAIERVKADAEVEDPTAADSEVVNLQGSDLRYDPRTGTIEPVTGIGQYGLTFDDAGRRIECSNRNPGLQIVLEARDARLNPLARISQLTHDAAAAGEASRIYPASRFWTTSNLHAGQFTAACGVLRFRGAEFSEVVAGAEEGLLLTCDPTGNLIHSETLVRQGAQLVGRPVANEREFVASLDSWFRPVDLQQGPDGSLYVVDMCRAVIEHPDFMPAELQSRADLRWGKSTGRIWRISSKNEARPAIDWAQRFGTPQALVESLSSSTGWERDSAFRLIMQQPGDWPLAQCVALRDNSDATVAARIAAFRLTTIAIAQGTEPSVVGLDQMGINRLISPSSPELSSDVLRWVRDVGRSQEIQDSTWVRLIGSADEELRMQVAISLYDSGSPFRIRTLAQLLSRSDDSWVRRGVLIGARNDAEELLALLDPKQDSDDSMHETLMDLTSMITRSPKSDQQGQATLAWIRRLGDDRETLRTKMLVSLVTGLGWAPTLIGGQTPEGWSADDRQWWDEWQTQTLTRISAVELETELRLAAIAAWGDLLDASPGHVSAAYGAQLLELLRSDEAPVIKVAAARRLKNRVAAEEWQELWSLFVSAGPALRAALLAASLETLEGRRELMGALETERVRPAELDANAARRLQGAEPEIAERFARWHSSLQASQNAVDPAPYLAAIETERDPYRGRQLFTMHCANCHRVGGIGTDVAPDISDSRVKLASQILQDVLNPNASIDANFVAYQAQTEDGQSYLGVLVTDTGSTVTLKLAGGERVTLARAELQEFASTGISLMPERLDRTLSPEDLADVVAFVKRWRYLEEGVPGVEVRREE